MPIVIEILLPYGSTVIVITNTVLIITAVTVMYEILSTVDLILQIILKNQRKHDLEITRKRQDLFKTDDTNCLTSLKNSSQIPFLLISYWGFNSAFGILRASLIM